MSQNFQEKDKELVSFGKLKKRKNSSSADNDAHTDDESFDVPQGDSMIQKAFSDEEQNENMVKKLKKNKTIHASSDEDDEDLTEETLDLINKKSNSNRNKASTGRNNNKFNDWLEDEEDTNEWLNKIHGGNELIENEEVIANDQVNDETENHNNNAVTKKKNAEEDDSDKDAEIAELSQRIGCTVEFAAHLFNFALSERNQTVITTNLRHLKDISNFSWYKIILPLRLIYFFLFILI
jgi:hypothetical protein